MPRARAISWREAMWDRTFSLFLALTVLGSVAVGGYVFIHNPTGQTFTEFYILGAQGTAGGYPERAPVGEEIAVTLGIVNREHEVMNYHVAVVVDGVESYGVGPIMLQPDERWEQPVGFSLHDVGDDRPVEFFLYRENTNEPYLGPLRLMIDVVEQSAQTAP